MAATAEGRMHKAYVEWVRAVDVRDDAQQALNRAQREVDATRLAYEEAQYDVEHPEEDS
jgi:hypothetical protein